MYTVTIIIISFIPCNLGVSGCVFDQSGIGFL